MRTVISVRRRFKPGSVLLLVMVALIILVASGVGMMTVAYGVRRDAIKARNEAMAMLAAEAGYERAIFRMSQQPDLLTALEDESFGASGSIDIIKPDEPGYEGDEDEQTGSVDYTISFDSFAGARAIYKVSATGTCGVFRRTVDVYVIQAISGWDMGMCRVPSGDASTEAVYYVNGEVIDMPLHINSYGSLYDSTRDIYISGSPDFLQTVTMSESRYSSGGSTDKYADVMYLFDQGIYFLQPSSRILDRDAIGRKLDHFRSTVLSHKPDQIFTPTKNNGVTNGQAAVQLEFFVDGDIGKVRITNDCTVRGYMKSSTWDYCIDADSEDLRFEKYYIYGYHYIPQNAETNGKRYTKDVTETYVTPTYGGIEGEPGGQIFVNGNVVIGGDNSSHSNNQLVKGRMTVVATGNIWIADSIILDGPHNGNGLPSENNPNVLGLVAQGIVKVVDPGVVETLGGPTTVGGIQYEAIGISDGALPYDRILPQYTEAEAAVTVGGGGWGAENVRRSSGSGRKEIPGVQNYLVVRGTITEAVRGVVGSGSDGYAKRYYLDERLLEGILPGDIWLKGKYVPAPAGWHDYRPDI